MKLLATLKSPLYYAGCAGCWVAYAAFYLGHAGVVDDFLSAHHAAGAVIAPMCLLIVSAAGGLLAMSAKPTSLWSALLSGLGAPGIIFGVSAGSESANAAGVKTAAIFTIPDASAGSLIGDSLRLVLSPVSAVEGHARRQTALSYETRIAWFEKEVDDSKAKIAMADNEGLRLREQIKSLQAGAESSDLRTQLAGVQAERDQLKGEIDRMKVESATATALRERMASLQRFHDEAVRLLNLNRTEKIKAEGVVQELWKQVNR